MNENGITVLSLFDGMSCGQIALKELGIKVEHVSNVALMMEHELRAKAECKDIPDKMINECIEKFKTAITSYVSEYTTECERCKKETA